MCDGRCRGCTDDGCLELAPGTLVVDAKGEEGRVPDPEHEEKLFARMYHGALNRRRRAALGRRDRMFHHGMKP